MHKRYGFTAIELTIVMVVMAILLAIGLVTFRGSLVSARDREREADVRTIAEYLESVYTQEMRYGSSTVINKPGSYPSTNVLLNSTTYYPVVFSELPTSATYAPGSSSVSLLRATERYPAPTLNQYYYIPLQSSGALCTAISQECRSFEIRYRSESTGSIVTVESRRR